jgi:ABC-type sugar transport system ATPase subunit
MHTEKLAKHFGGVRAVQEVTLDLWRNEILGLVGDNAAGKSTFLKTLAGVYSPTSGQIFVEGKEARFHTPADARKLGIEMIYQDFALCPNLDVPSNLFLGREIKVGPLQISDRSRMEEESVKRLAEIGITVPTIKTKARFLSGGQQQAVAIGRALVFGPKVVLMDEPLANMSQSARDRILAVIQDLRARGISIILVSHVLTDVFAIADRIAVLRFGRLVANKLKNETTAQEIATTMHGI